jgi:AcrR family transcriptional regulator
MEPTSGPHSGVNPPVPHPDDPTSEAVSLVREPLQDRSRRTLRRIVDAGLHLLATEGPDALTVTGIVRRARTSVGSFYARFPGKDDLLRYLGERALEEASEGWAEVHQEVAACREPAEKVGALVEGLGELYLEGAGRDLMLLDGIEDPLPTRRDRLSSLLAADLGGLFEVTETGGELLTRILVAILGDPQGGSRERLGPELVKLISAYLVAPASTEGAPTRTGEPGPGREVEDLREPGPGAARDEDEDGDEDEDEPSPAEPDPFEVWG